jgi:hypothetical protein
MIFALLGWLVPTREFGGRSARVLDAGGWYRPFNLATHVIDLNPYDSRRVDDACHCRR